MNNHRRASTPSDRITDGILLVDKPAGPTSHDVVDCIRDRFKIEKVGHGGTLDPMATGLLILLLGRGTKLSNFIIGTDKVYEGTLHLGVSTDSQDIDGKVMATADAEGVTREQLEDEMKKRVGDIMQTPPMVSAVKKNGVPLYKLARKGKTVEREPRLIHIYDFLLREFANPLAYFTLRCTKGTYVRTLCADIGQALGCGAFLERLRRTQSGSFKVEKAIPLENLIKLELSDLTNLIIPVHQLNIRELDLS